MVWLWASLFVVTIIFEIVTVEMISIWFSVGSLVSFILALFGVSDSIQIIVFLIVSVVLLCAARNVCKKLLKNSKEKTNIDSVIGTTHTLLKSIDADNAGEIKLNDIKWRVVSASGEKIEQGSKVKIVQVSGNKFIVEKEKN